MGTDGDFTSWWKSDSRQNEWVLYDLGALRPVAGVTIYKEEERIDHGAVQVTSHSLSVVFTTVIEFNSPSGQSIAEVAFETVEAQFIRIFVFDAHGQSAFIGWREVEFIIACFDA